MKRQAIVSIVAVVILTLGVIAGGVYLLGSGTNSTGQASSAAGETTASTPAPEPSQAQNVAERPTCPSTGAGGIELPCLGAETGEQPQDAGVTVVNVWAWWCGPCRDELPYFEEFAESHPEYNVVGVHADANASNGAAFLNDINVDLPSYQDADNTFAGTLGLPGVVPITLVFEGTEQKAMLPTPFESAEEIETAVDEALAGAA